MAGIFLASYSLEVREKGTKDPLPLDSGAGQSLYTTVKALLEAAASYQHDPAAQHLLRVTTIKSDKTDIWGLVERGEAGIGAVGISTKTLKKSYERTPDDAEMVPLYFRFHLPDDGLRGLLIMQRVGMLGALSDLRTLVMKRFHELFPDHTLRIGRCVPPEVIQNLLQGGIHELQLVLYSMPADIAEKVRLKGASSEVGSLQIRVKAKRGMALLAKHPGWMARLLEGRASIAEVFGDDAKSMRLRIPYNGRLRTFDLAKPEAAAPYLDITADVPLTAKGHADFDKLDAECLTLRDEILEKFGAEKTD